MTGFLRFAGRAFPTGLVPFSFVAGTAVQAPSKTGPYAYSPPYGSFQDGDASFINAGQTYVDPVFGTTVRRLTQQSLTGSSFSSDIYIKNGFWNADATYFVNSMDDGTIKAVHAVTGALKPLVNAGNPGRLDASFHPVNPDEYIYNTGTTRRRQLVSTGAVTTLKDFGATLGGLGGSLNNLDLSGRYHLLNVGGNLTTSALRVWDSQTDTLYSGSIVQNIGSGHASISPDAAYVIVVPGAAKIRFAIDHTAKTVDTVGTTFFTGGGDHCGVMLASDGKLYLIRADNDTNPARLQRIEVATGAISYPFTFPGVGSGAASDPYWTSCPNHLSVVSRGAYQDWVFCSSDLEYAGGSGASIVAADNFTGADPVATWNKLQNEIFAINVLTGAIRRLAHTRGRESASVYNYQPRVCASWGGERIAWSSNMGFKSSPIGHADIYSIAVPT